MHTHYRQIEQAIIYINEHHQEQPSLEEVAQHLNLSKAHFQRIFSSWAGISPKRYLQVLSLEHAKKLLRQCKPHLEVSLNLGLSSSSRLHDHFIHLEAVTPGEYRAKGLGLDIFYGMHDSPFGNVFIAITSRGICKLSFIKEKDLSTELQILKTTWPEANISLGETKTQELIAKIFNRKKSKDEPLSLLVQGTNFQVNVWKALLRLDTAQLCTYQDIAKSIHKPNAYRAVGTAIGRNPIAFVIPCHRVIQKSGKIGGYHWGENIKHAIHAWEIAGIDR